MAGRLAQTRLVLCRHGEPEDAFSGRCYGRLDVALSPRGLRQAKALAERLAGRRLAAVYASPARRALQTAEAIASVHGLAPIAHPALAELDFGELEGLRYEEIAERHPELYAAWTGAPTRVRFPGGESYRELRARVLDALAELRERHRGEAFAAVGHGGPIRVVLAACLGMPEEAIFRLDQRYGAISVVDWVGEEPVVRAVNVDPASCLPLDERAGASSLALSGFGDDA